MGLERPIKKIAGDGLSLKLQCNEQVLEVKGDGCDVTMAMNCGSVRIIGDGCRLTIDRNMGDVEYTGDGGRVHLGRKSNRDKVRYNGDGGRISFDGERRTKNRKPKDNSTGERPVGSIQGDRCPEKGSNDPLARKEVENALNGRKEGKGVGVGCKVETEERSTRAKIVTSLECDKKIVKKWFVDPEAVVRTLDGASFVKIVPRQVKTKIVVN